MNSSKYSHGPTIGVGATNKIFAAFKAEIVIEKISKMFNIFDWKKKMNQRSICDDATDTFDYRRVKIIFIQTTEK